MGFEPKRINNGASGFVTVKVPLDKSQTIVKGQPLTPASGYFKAATADTSANIAIAAEAKTTTSAAYGEIEVYSPADILYEVPYTGTTKAVPVAADMFTGMDIAAGGASINLDEATVIGQFIVHGFNTTRKTLLVANAKPIPGL